MNCERLESLRRVQVSLHEDQRVLRKALQESDKPEDEGDVLLGEDRESEIPSAIRTIAQAQREIDEEIRLHKASCSVCGGEG